MSHAASSSSPIDDDTVAYIIEHRRHFEDLSQVARVDGGYRRVITVHEERLKDLLPSRITKTGLRITELAPADGEPSRVR